MKKLDGPYDLESLMGTLGDFGKYQAWQFTLHILSALTAGLNMLTLVTVAAVPDHRCEIPGYDVNQTYTKLNFTEMTKHFPLLDPAVGKFDKCSLINSTTNVPYKCSSFVYDHTYYGTSRAIEWEFICDRRWMGALAQSIYMIGVFTGAVVLGKMADKYGRKPIFCWSAILQLILGVSVAFTPEYISFLVLRYLYGIFGSAGAYIPGFVLTMELVGPSKRSMCGVAFQAVFAVGIMLVAGWGALIKDRQILQIIYGCHALLLVGHIWLMDESPRWLWSNGRIRESVEIVKKALKMNGSPISLDTAEFVSKGMSEVRTSEESGSIGDLFRTPNLRKKTFNVLLCWFANSLVYYGLSLTTNSMEGNPFINMFIMGLVEIPSYILTVYLMDRLGRRTLTAVEMILGAICCIIAANVTAGAASMTFMFTGKFLIASSFAIIYNFSAELFPTMVRSFVMGLGAMCARGAGAAIPLMSLLDSFDPKIPAMIFSVVSLISGFLVMFLPETLNKPMPQTLQEGEEFGVGDTTFSSLCGEKRDRSLRKPSKTETEQMQALR
ncbi:organic cation transporter protein [Diabrotica virgifera virgifera]|uniref:Major facilitator superfamily (MFS) profile domain-containing protein n=1 Tax=Diabrotica virgifera virgifera TaxID=50390 RepID=A0ABM5KEY5_DIAVI|nr:organic cation transporter protein [Diabrotica virgifera virgifera]